MNFNTLEFLLFFPVVLGAYWLLPGRFRWMLLLTASYLFYLYWNPWTGLLLLGTTLVSWLAARGIDRAAGDRGRRGWLLLAVTVSLGCLVFFKYTGLLAESAGTVAGLFGGEVSRVTVDIILPVGISFYTFQTLSYVLDVYRGTIRPEEHFGYYALFVSFFPQLVAGPIERPEHLLPQLREEHRLRGEDLFAGLWLMLQGYFKKLMIADRLAPMVDAVYASPETATGPAVALATLLFALQIYGDFSGYSDIARGTARMLGIRLMENFRRPYAAQSIRDFWRRWHISLTSWFTDYLYKPLGGSWKGLPRQCANTMLVFLVSGLWHGADWTFLIWGGLHGLYQVCGVLWRRLAGKSLPGGRIASALRRTRTLLLVCFAWLFFRAGSMEEAGLLLVRLSKFWDMEGWTAAFVGMGLKGTTALSFLLACLCLWLMSRVEVEQGRGFRREIGFALAVFFCVTAIALAWLAALSTHGENAFLYFQF